MAKLSKLQKSYLIALITTGHQVVGSWDHGYTMKKIGGLAQSDSETTPKYTMKFQEASYFYLKNKVIFFLQELTYSH